MRECYIKINIQTFSNLSTSLITIRCRSSFPALRSRALSATCIRPLSRNLDIQYRPNWIPTSQQLHHLCIRHRFAVCQSYLSCEFVIFSFHHNAILIIHKCLLFFNSQRKYFFSRIMTFTTFSLKLFQYLEP